MTNFSAPNTKPPPSEPVERMFLTRWNGTNIVIRRVVQNGEVRTYLERIATVEDELSLPAL